MNTLTRIFLMFLLVSLLGCKPDENVQYVEGLHYESGQPVRIEIVDGLITGIKELGSTAGIPDIYVAPGLIDIQINGYMGVDFSDQELTPEMMQKASEALWKEGVTSYLPTVITRDQERQVRSFALLSRARKQREVALSVPGYHLEGPYISPVAGYRGAHPEEHVRLPDWQEFSELQESAQEGIRLVAVAPELEGAIPFIQKCSENGLVTTLAHHNGSPAEIDLAVEAGATLSNHLGNGCANEINRHHNPLWPQLSNDGLSVSLIVDGAHLTREEVRTFYKVKGPENTILVSDALSFAGLPLGIYEKDGFTYELTSEVVKFPSENVLAGAAMPLSKCIGKVMDYTGCSLPEAIRMASTNPARLMGLDHLGRIGEGLRADLFQFTLEEGQLHIQKTWIAGELVYTKE
jgi:N-acetylglucosamine-6-phosphate deacetylase